jgi:hypothetical protein
MTRLYRGSNHGYASPKQALETYFAASCEVLYPPLRGIVQLTNSATLRLQNWSFTISWNAYNNTENFCQDFFHCPFHPIKNDL